MSDLRIADVRITPIAFYDPPLLNCGGCHQAFALRSIIEVETEDGIIGLGESYGVKSLLDALDLLKPTLVSMPVTDLNGLWSRARALDIQKPGLLPRMVSAIEVACWDALGKSLGLPLCELLGGKVRESVQFSAYLFYKFARHQHEVTNDTWGEVLTPEALVEEARRMITEYGFKAIKLKAGILPVEDEMAGLEALHSAFPDAPLRIDPNGAWHVHTTLELLPRLQGLIEYLEDPTMDLQGMAVIQAATDIPLATNMCVVANEHLPPSIKQGSVRVILSDHHYWGGLQASRHLARICDIWGLGLSMHSNSHLGISLAAMTHLAAATPNLSYDCDTHYPWQTDEVIEGGKLRFNDGALPVPEGAGLGVTLDRDELARLHDNYLKHGYENRDDETELQKYWPDWRFRQPRF
ncbi:MAG: enolase C-terminal domain-like protein [Granulosicoccus sp.]